MKRTLILLLTAALFVLPVLTACSSGGAAVQDTGAPGETTATEPEATETERIYPKYEADYDGAEFNMLYFDAVAESVRRSHPDIIGHLDLVTKFNENGRFFDETDPRYLAAAYDLIDRLLPNNVPFEVNTGAISRGYRTAPYPAKPLRDYILSRGGRLILSSDAHRKEDLMFGFEALSSLSGSCDYSFLDRR